MPEIDVRLDTGELDLRLVLMADRSYGTVLDIEFAKGVTVNGSPDGYREFARELLDLIDATCPEPRNELADLPVHDGLAGRSEDGPRCFGRCPYCDARQRAGQDATETER